MSRNSEVVFSDLPQVDIPRSIFDISQDIKTTFNVGKLIPFYVNECIPGSSVKINTHKVVRLQTLLTPLMDPIYLDTYYFFVPSRLVFDKFKEFMGENTSSAYLPQVEYTIPQFQIGGSTGGAVETGSVLDYMGVPLISANAAYSIGISELPVRGYVMIWNEFFRDQNLQSPKNITYGTSGHNWKNFTVKNPLPVNRYHDYFSSALIAPAKNTDGFVTAWTSRKRLTGDSPYEDAYFAPVYSGSVLHDVSSYAIHGSTNGAGVTATGVNISNSYGEPPFTVLMQQSDTVATSGFKPDNMYADLQFNQFGITIPNLRQAFQMQKFLERDASHGTRYQEQLLAHFGVRAQDSRLQRPEYLGGNRIPLNINQIVNQASSSGEFLGDVGGMSLTTDSHHDVEYSIQEHGYIIGLMCCRYKNSYSQGLERFWFKDSKFDFAFPEFAHLTDQTVLSGEIFIDETDPTYANSVFGYQERYAEYKHKPNKVTGQMRPGISGSLAAWHLGDYYTSKVYLSDSWLQVDKANVDRALTVTSTLADQLFADIVVQARWTLPLPVHSNPGFADHF